MNQKIEELKTVEFEFVIWDKFVRLAVKQKIEKKAD